MLTLTAMVTHGVPDAPPADPPPALPRCQGCPSLVTRHHPAGMAGPGVTSARCLAAGDGRRLIGWHWQPQDAPPHWCPRRGGQA